MCRLKIERKGKNLTRRERKRREAGDEREKKVGLRVQGKTDISRGKGGKRGINRADRIDCTKFSREGKEGARYSRKLSPLANTSPSSPKEVAFQRLNHCGGLLHGGDGS